MKFLIIYGIIILALSLLLTGYYNQTPTIYLFDWVWLLYFGKMFALLFMKNDEPATQEERQLLLEKERDQGMAPLIPIQTYFIYAILELANVFLICIELFYMSFGLFIMAQTIVFSAYLVYRKNKDIMCYVYTSMLMIAGILSLAYNSQGNDRCYIGLIATLILMVSNIMTIDYKEQFQRTYIYQNSKLIGFGGIIQFFFWIIILIVAQFLNCSNPCGNKCSSFTNLDQTTTFFSNTFGTQNGYLLIIFIILIVVGAPLQYLDNKISQEKLFDKKQIVECLLYFPIQLWLFISGADLKCPNPNANITTSQDKTILEILSLVFFIIQWFIGLYLLFYKTEQAEYEHLQEEEDSEIS